MVDRQRFETFSDYRHKKQHRRDVAPIGETAVESQDLKTDLPITYREPTLEEQDRFEAVVAGIRRRVRPKRGEIIPELESLRNYGTNSVLFHLGDVPPNLQDRVAKAMLRNRISSIEDLARRVDRVNFLGGPLTGSYIVAIQVNARRILEERNSNSGS